MSFLTLMYHEIREDDAIKELKPSQINVRQDYQDLLPPPLFVGLEQFSKQMQLLAQEGFHTLTMAEVKAFILNKKELPKKSVLITFDDCYQSMQQYAYPVLRSLGFHATAFVVSGWLHQEKQGFDPSKSVCLSQMELQELSDVYDFANHSHSMHTRINPETSALLISTDSEIIEDITTCGELELVNHKDVFAYPFGLYHEKTLSTGITSQFNTP